MESFTKAAKGWTRAHKNRQSQTDHGILSRHRHQSQSRSSSCGTTSQVQCIFPLFVTETFGSVLNLTNTGQAALSCWSPPCDWHVKPSRSWPLFPLPSLLLHDFHWELQCGCSWRICWLLFFFLMRISQGPSKPTSEIHRSWRWKGPRSSMSLLPLPPSPFVQCVIVSYNVFLLCLLAW